MKRKSKIVFIPFANESDALGIGEDFSIENRLDRVSLYGSLDITRDKEGLEKALALKEIVDEVVAALQGKPLPDKIEFAPIKMAPNPFEKR